MSHIRLLILAVMFEFLPMIASGQPMATQAGWLDSMRLGGYVIVLRHGLTSTDPLVDPMANPMKSTDPMSNPARNGAPERQLSEQGRAQAKFIGESMRKLKIPVGVVMTSPLQRAVNTGTLLDFGEVTTLPELAEAGAALSDEENNRRAETLRRLASLHPPADNNLVIVTH